jgi:hypothetical protein
MFVDSAVYPTRQDFDHIQWLVDGSEGRIDYILEADQQGLDKSLSAPTRMSYLVLRLLSSDSKYRVAAALPPTWTNWIPTWLRSACIESNSLAAFTMTRSGSVSARSASDMSAKKN